VAADGGVQGVSREGGEGVAAHPVGDGGVWRKGVMSVSTSEVWRLDLGELRWERLPSLTRGRGAHACCAVRGGNVVLGA
jgi:hypothetical protein